MKPIDRPIGVFDSGLGGLTVFAALAQRMPQESLIYFGDTAHVPYGSKSKETVTRYSVAIAKFLASQDIKALVVACNTSSALALPAIEAAVNVPVIGVIEAGAKAAAKAAARRRVGVIGTEATIKSGAYQAALKRKLPKAKVTAAACPLFVPLVEEGWWDDAITTEVAHRYLAPLRAAKPDALILGCTHYPLLKATIQKVMGPDVLLIDSAEQTALETKWKLAERKLRRLRGVGKHKFYVSDAPEKFVKVSQRFLGKTIKQVALRAV